jgi:DNA-3-methyladenine glycosylase II
MTASKIDQSAVAQVLDRVLGLSVDLGPFYAMAAKEPRLDNLATRFRGMKPPRFPSVFEALVNAMSCQQISLQAGLTLLNRLVAAYGQTPLLAAGGRRAFPRPKDLAVADLQSLRALGFSHNKSLAIIELASALTHRRVELEALSQLDDGSACNKLQELRGVGRWTAEYVLLRGLGRIHIFPGDDIGARNNLQRWLRRKRALDYEGTKRAVARWHPYAGLMYLHLLLEHLADEGTISEL